MLIYKAQTLMKAKSEITKNKMLFISMAIWKIEETAHRMAQKVNSSIDKRSIVNHFFSSWFSILVALFRFCIFLVAQHI